MKYGRGILLNLLEKVFNCVKAPMVLGKIILGADRLVLSFLLVMVF